jgi:hypothetical protein
MTESPIAVTGPNTPTLGGVAGNVAGADVVVTAGAVVGVVGRTWVGLTDGGNDATGPTAELPQPARVTAAIVTATSKPATRFRDSVLTNVIRARENPRSATSLTEPSSPGRINA